MVGKADLHRFQALPDFDQSSCVFSSFRNRVERSAFSMRVASPMTFCSSEPA